MKELKMLLLLTNSKKKWCKTELAQKLDVSVRTIERYIVKLKAVGFIFIDDCHYVALKQTTAVYNKLSDLVYFSEEEATTLYNALEVIETDTKAKRDLREKLATIYSSKKVKEKIIRLQGAKKMEDLMEAIEKRRRVIIKNYLSPSSQTKSDRLVEPFLVSEGGKQVWCWEVESGKNKVFNISRIECIEKLPDCWQCSMYHKAGYTDAFRIISFTGETKHIVLRLNRMAYSLLIEEYPLTEQDITQTGENEWTYEAEVSNYKGIGRFVLGLADCIKVETAELCEYLQTFAENHLMFHHKDIIP